MAQYDGAHPATFAFLVRGVVAVEPRGDLTASSSAVIASVSLRLVTFAAVLSAGGNSAAIAWSGVEPSCS